MDLNEFIVRIFFFLIEKQKTLWFYSLLWTKKHSKKFGNFNLDRNGFKESKSGRIKQIHFYLFQFILVYWVIQYASI